jgi:hypothetical protein
MTTPNILRQGLLQFFNKQEANRIMSRCVPDEWTLPTAIIARETDLEPLMVKDGDNNLLVLSNQCGYAGAAETQTATCTVLPGEATIPSRDWYCTNKPNIDMAFDWPFSSEVPLSSVSVAANFSPGSGALYNHGVELSVNSSQVGTGIVPQSPVLTFDVPPSYLIPGARTQALNLRSLHTNNAHYVISSDFSLSVSHDSYERQQCTVPGQSGGTNGMFATMSSSETVVCESLPGEVPLPEPPVSTFTDIDFYGEDEVLQGVMFWAAFWELSQDIYDSGSPVDTDLSQRYTEFLFDELQDYCTPGANPPSDNAAENIIIGDPINDGSSYWLYIKHCPRDHRFMFVRTMMNGFLNNERQYPDEPLLSHVQGNYHSLMNRPANLIWSISPCQDQGNEGSSFLDAEESGTLAAWLHGYMICLGTNPDVDLENSKTVQGVRRAYESTIFPQIQAALANFYDLSAPTSDPTMGDPTYGAFGNVVANLMGDVYYACVGGCYLSKADRDAGNVTYVYRWSQVTPEQHEFVKLRDDITFGDVIHAYNLHTQSQIIGTCPSTGYCPLYSSVLQPTLLRQDNGYLWVTRVYQRSQDMSHFPR